MIDRIELSNDERMILKDMTESDGWKIYVDKIWKPIRAQNIERCRVAIAEHRYVQGFDQGFEFAKTVLYTNLKPPTEPETEAEQGMSSDARQGV